MNTATLPEVSTFAFNIPSSRLSDVEARIDALNRKCVKLSIAPITIEKSREIVKQIRTEVPATALDASYVRVDDVLFTPCTVTFHPVKVAGNHRFVAAIEHEVVNGKNHNLVSGYALDKDIETAYRHVASECQHCNVSRMRNKTFIVQNIDNGSTVQVGSSCIKDFFACDVAAAVLSIDICAELASFDDEEEGYGSSHGSNLIRLDTLVSYSVAQIRQFGFMSATKAKEESDYGNFTTSTATLVTCQIYPDSRMKPEDRLVVSDEDKDVAKGIIAKWNDELVSALDNNSDTLDSFQYKIAITTALGYVKSNMVSTIVGSVGFALRKQQEAKTPKLMCDEFLPGVEVKSKIEMELTVARLHKFEGSYGTTTILSFKDKDGRACVWFASGSLDESEWGIGSTVNVKGTVKSLQNDAKYGKQTVLTRVKKV